MREKLWLAARQSTYVPRLRAIPLLGELMTGASHLLLPSHSQYRVRVREGPGKDLILTLNPRWETALWQGNYEFGVQMALANLVGDGQLLYDVGGGIGFYSLLAAKRGGRALVFEPDAYNASCIRANAEANGLASQIQVIEQAAFSHTGLLALRPAGQTRGHGSAHSVNVAAVTSLGKVRCTRLDDLIDSQEPPHVMKIDVEGAERAVLEGAETLFKRFRPHVICEVHDMPTASFVKEWLGRMNYRLRWLELPNSLPSQLMGSPD